MNLREAFCFCAVFQWAKFPRDNMTDRSPKDKKKKKKSLKTQKEIAYILRHKAKNELK